MADSTSTVPVPLFFGPEPPFFLLAVPVSPSFALFFYSWKSLFPSLKPWFLLFAPPFPLLNGPFGRRNAVSCLSPFFPPFPLKCSVMPFVLSNIAKKSGFSQTFLSKHLEGMKKHRIFAPAFPNKAYAEKGRAINISDL